MVKFSGISKFYLVYFVTYILRNQWVHSLKYIKDMLIANLTGVA